MGRLSKKGSESDETREFIMEVGAEASSNIHYRQSYLTVYKVAIVGEIDHC